VCSNRDYKDILEITTLSNGRRTVRRFKEPIKEPVPETDDKPTSTCTEKGSLKQCGQC
jgi:uncharacterized protein YkwD